MAVRVDPIKLYLLGVLISFIFVITNLSSKKSLNILSLSVHVHVTVYFCFKGAQIEEVWEEASSSMKKVGLGIGIINVNRSPRLVDALGAGRVPTIISVINGRVMFYNDRVTVQGLKDFVMGLFPSGLIEKVRINFNYFFFQKIKL